MYFHVSQNLFLKIYLHCNCCKSYTFLELSLLLGLLAVSTYLKTGRCTKYYKCNYAGYTDLKKFSFLKLFKKKYCKLNNAGALPVLDFPNTWYTIPRWTIYLPLNSRFLNVPTHLDHLHFYENSQHKWKWVTVSEHGEVTYV